MGIPDSKCGGMNSTDHGCLDPAPAPPFAVVSASREKSLQKRVHPLRKRHGGGPEMADPKPARTVPWTAAKTSSRSELFSRSPLLTVY